MNPIFEEISRNIKKLLYLNLDCKNLNLGNNGAENISAFFILCS